MEDSTIKALFAMGCITALECVALLQGINGTLLSAGVAVLAGLGGYSIKAYIDREK